MTRYFFLFGFLLAGPALPAFADESAANGQVSISAKAETLTPYQDEPILYTVRSVSRASLSDVTLSDLTVENAIVTRQGDPEVHVAVVDGMPAKVVEFHYLVTPMQPGKITIPSVILQGNIETEDRVASDVPFGENFMAGVRQVMKALSNFTSGRPFKVSSNPTLLDVRPPVAAMDPWLPLKSLKIEEDTTAPQQPQVGEPMLRKITLSSVGAVGSQLPDIEAQEDHNNFRVYADRPVTKTAIDKDSGAVSGQRTESYSMVPQRAGRLVMPAIRISWWDTVNNRAATTVLPARAITVQPGAPVKNPNVPGSGHVAEAPSGGGQPAAHWGDALLTDTLSLLPYAAAAALVILLLLGGFAGVRLWRAIRRRRPDGSPMNKKNSAPRPLSLTMLKQVHSAEELNSFLHAYAQQRWGTPANAPLEVILPMLPNHGEDAELLVTALTGALYAGKPIDIEDLKTRTRRLLAGPKRVHGSRRRAGDKLPSLNPS